MCYLVVIEPPNEIAEPSIVILEFVNCEFPILVICEEPDTTPPINSAESVSPLKIILTSSVSVTAKFVCEDISTVPAVISCPLIDK